MIDQFVAFCLHHRRSVITMAVLLAAFAAIGPQFPEARLVLFGKGGRMADRERTYRAELGRFGLVDRVVETRFLSDADLWHLYSRSDLFVFPTLYEVFGYPALEAMAAGACARRWRRWSVPPECKWSP